MLYRSTKSKRIAAKAAPTGKSSALFLKLNFTDDAKRPFQEAEWNRCVRG